MVSGKYFFPNAPLLCLKWMPAWEVTSVNSIGPEGRAAPSIGADAGGGGAVADTGAGELAVGCGEAVSCEVEACCLHPLSNIEASSVRQQVARILIASLVSFSRLPSWSVNHRATASFSAPARLESSQISISMAVGPTMKSA